MPEASAVFWNGTDTIGPPNRTISLFAWDHIFLRGFDLDQVKEVGVVRDNQKASDHKPVWITVGLDGSLARGLATL